jgi:hypothetical protein
MFDFTSFLTPEMIAMLLMFLSAMQGADGTSWLIKLVKALASMVNIPVTKRDGAFALPANLLPILLIGGVVMFMMMSGGGCGGGCSLPISSEVKADVQEKPAPVIDLGGDPGELYLAPIPATADRPATDTGSSGLGGAGEISGPYADASDNVINAPGHGELVYNPGRGREATRPDASCTGASCSSSNARAPRSFPRLFRRRG